MDSKITMATQRHKKRKRNWPGEHAEEGRLIHPAGE